MANTIILKDTNNNTNGVIDLVKLASIDLNKLSHVNLTDLLTLLAKLIKDGSVVIPASYKFTATGGQTVFTVDGIALSPTPLVFCNGAIQTVDDDYTVDVDNKKITFKDGKSDKDVIIIYG
jgi:hypothetical protein